jgi:hypothetical protein
MVATAILQTFLINGTIMVMFILMGLKIVSRKRTRLSITLAMFFLVEASGLLVNVLYRVIDDYEFNIIGNKITIFLNSLGVINLLCFNLMLLKSEKVFTLNKQLMITIGYAIALGVLFFIPEGVEWAYESGRGLTGYNTRATDPLDVGVPVWSLYFGLYGLIVSQISFVFIISSAIQLYRSMGGSNSKFGKKYISNIIGILLFDVILAGNFLFNTWNDPTGRLALLIVSITIIPGALMVYWGLKKDE